MSDSCYEATKTKILENTDVNQAAKNVPDLKVFGYSDLFVLLSKASSVQEGWMESTKVMEIEGVGCVVRVTTQCAANVTEALTFVPGVCIKIVEGGGRKLVKA